MPSNKNAVISKHSRPSIGPVSRPSSAPCSKKSGQGGVPQLKLRATTLVPAPTPLSRLRDFHFIPTAQKDSEPPWEEVSESLSNAQTKRPERQWPLPKDRHCPQTFLMGSAEPEDCHSASASYSGTPNIRSVYARSARLKKKRCRDSGHYSPENCGHYATFRDAPSSYVPDRNFLLLKS